MDGLKSHPGDGGGQIREPEAPSRLEAAICTVRFRIRQKRSIPTPGSILARWMPIRVFSSQPVWWCGWKTVRSIEIL